MSSMELESFLKSHNILEGFDETFTTALESCPISPYFAFLAKACCGFDFNASAVDALSEGSCSEVPTAYSSPLAASSTNSQMESSPSPSSAYDSQMECNEEDDEDEEQEQEQHQHQHQHVDETPTKKAAASKPAARPSGPSQKKKSGKRKWSRSHTRKEPTSDEFGSHEEYMAAWTRWRELRDNNNNAVKRSRENKKRMLPFQCRQARCVHLHSTVEALEKRTALLIKAIRAPSSLSTLEKKDLEHIMA